MIWTKIPNFIDNCSYPKFFARNKWRIQSSVREERCNFLFGYLLTFEFTKIEKFAD